MNKMLLLFSLVISPVVMAHHSAAQYDMEKTVIIEGIVKTLEWTNPHMWLWVEVTHEDGTIEQWGLEGASPANMNRRAGWTKRSVLPGERVTVEVRPMKSGEPGGALAKVTREDGSILGTGIPAAPSPEAPKY